jgi:hypothetical protein
VKPASAVVGPKTGVYYRQGNPTLKPTHTGTNDIFHARALGFWEKDKKTGKRKDWSSGLSPQQHAYMDGETLLAVDRANAQKLGGKSDWTAHQVQAAAWVAAKGRSLAKQRPKAMGGGRGLEEAAKGYGDFLPDYTAHTPIDEIPGRATGHLPQLIDATPEEKAAYTLGWGDEAGRDILPSAQGMLVRPSKPATGTYTSSTGQFETGPINVGRPLVSLDPKTKGARARDMEILRSQGLLRAIGDAQEMAGSNFATSRGAKGSMQGLRIPLDRPISGKEAEELSRVAGAESLWPSDTGEGVILGPFNPKSRGNALRRAMSKKGGLSERIEGVVGAKPELARVQSTMEDLSPLWKESGENIDVAPLTEKLLSAPGVQKLVDSPRVRDAFAQRYARDLEFAKRGFPVNEKVQNFRHIIATGGYDALVKSLKAGVPLPAVAFMLSELRGEEPGA